MNEDNIYLERFLTGEEQGFEMLVRKYQNRALNIVYSLIGKDRESEDITQEVFLKVYRSLRSFRRRCRFSTWLYRIVINTTYDFLRRRRNVTPDEDTAERNSSIEINPREVFFAREREAEVRRALQRVPLSFRPALVLKDIEGLSYNEIAGILRCSVGTVESKIYRARQFLKKELVKSGVGAV